MTAKKRSRDKNNENSPAAIIRVARTSWFAWSIKVLLLLGILGLSACTKEDAGDAGGGAGASSAGGGGGAGGTGAQAALELLVVSPHGANIRNQFAAAFAAWYQQKYHETVHVEWPDHGATNLIVQYLAAQYAAHDTCGEDVVFGGGSATFNELAARHFIVPATLPAEVTDRLPREIQGVPLRGEGDIWLGATMSQFGIIANPRRAQELGLPLPVEWKDLSAPSFFGLVSAADPSGSGSVRTCFECVLQQYGWERGWPVLVKLFANSSKVVDSGNLVADEVGQGNDVAGPIIDFFGRLEMRKAGDDDAKFIVPRGGTPIDPDPIALLKGSPHQEVAQRFMEFVLSPVGQRLWVFKAGIPGGPTGESPLGRMSVLPELYEKEAANMTDGTNPFTGAGALKFDQTVQTQRAVVLGDLIKYALIKNIDALKAARKAVRDAGDKPELLAMFDVLPFPGDELPAVAAKFKSGQHEAQDLRANWQAAYARQFAAISAAAK